jgi:hypothetical protein
MKPKRPTLMPMPSYQIRTSGWIALIAKWRSMGILAR